MAKLVVPLQRLVTLTEVMEGDIYSIPLFLDPQTQMKSFSRTNFGKEGEEFCFCRIISYEGGSGIFIEVFDHIGKFDDDIATILSAPRMFDPIPISGIGIVKKRWRKVGETDGYDKETHSKYSKITLLIGPNDDLRVWKNGVERPLADTDDGNKIERFKTWVEARVEMRIRDVLAGRAN